MVRTFVKSSGASASSDEVGLARVDVVPKLTPDPPRAWLVSGRFATGRLAVDAPVHVVAAQGTARKLDVALAGSGRTRTEVAASAGVARSTLYAVLAGDVFPDFVSIARLSAALGVALWPDPVS